MAVGNKVVQGGGSGGIFPGDSQTVVQGQQNTVVVEQRGAVINDATRILDFTGDSVNVSKLGSKAVVEVTGTVGPPGPQGEDANAVAYDATTTYSSGELAHDASFNVYISLLDDNLNNGLDDATYWRILNSGDGNISFADTPNDGNLLGVDFTETLSVITATVLNNATPHPGAEVSASASASTVEEGFTSPQTITYTVSVGPSGDFTFDAITTAHSNKGTTSVNGNVVTLVVPVSENDPQVISTSITLTYTNDSDSTVHTDVLRETLTIAGNFGTLLSTSTPTALTDFSNLAVWTGSNTRTFTGNNTNRSLYYIMPTRTDGYTFKTGPLFVTPTASSVIGDHTLYTIGDFDDSQSGETFILTVTET